MQPQRFDHIFKAEHASKQKTKYRGEEPTAGNDGCQVHLLCPVQQVSAKHQAQALPASPNMTKPNKNEYVRPRMMVGSISS